MSPTPEPLSPSSRNNEALGLYVSTVVNLKTDSKTLCYMQFTEIKIYSFCDQAQQRLKELCIVKQ